VLAILSVVGGIIFKVPDFLGTLFPHLEEAENTGLMITSVAFGAAGILIAILMYVAKPALAESFASGMKGLYTLVYNKYFVDEIYDATVVKPVVGGSRWVLWRGVDVGVIDGLANGIATASRGVGGVLRLLQSGNIRSYAAWVVFGSVALMVALGMLAGGAR
jgi:NADH-quinone oxidoreductase subunit L